jgi:hypothetical protein
LAVKHRRLRLSTLNWRRSLSLAAVVGAAQLVAMLPIRNDWLGVWSQTASVFGQSLILTLPVAVAIATWHFGQLRQSTLGVFEQTSPRRQWSREVRQVAEFAAVAGAGLVAAAIGVGFATGVRATYGGPDLLTLLAVVAWMAVAGSVGRRCSGIGIFAVTAPIAGVAAYALLAWVVVRDQGTAGVVAPMDWRWMSLFSKAGWVSVLQACLAASLAAFILGLRPRARAFRWSTGIAAVGIWIILVTWGTAASRQPDQGAARLICRPAASERIMCLPIVKGYQREQLVRAWSVLDRSAPGLLSEDLVFINDEARGLGKETDGQISAAVAGFRPRPTLVASATIDLSAVTQLPQDEFVAQTVDLLVSPQVDVEDTTDAPPNSSDPRMPATPSLLVRGWLYQRLGLPGDGSAYPGAPQIDAATVNYSARREEMNWFAGLSVDRRRQWLTKNRAELQAGTVPWSALAEN